MDSEPDSRRSNACGGDRTDVGAQLPLSLGESGGVSSCSALAGPVGQTGICLFGIGGCGYWGFAEAFVSSNERGGVMGPSRADAGLWGGMGRVRAIVAISKEQRGREDPTSSM
jgi:hypothetical protein